MTNLEQRIRERAYHLWEADGRPHGKDVEYWERARFLVGIEDNADAALLPNPIVEAEARGWHTPPPPEPVEPIEALINQGEFPDRFADQGEKTPGPVVKQAKAAPEGPKAKPAPKAAAKTESTAPKAAKPKAKAKRKE
jgi:hypothetical protein